MNATLTKMKDGTVQELDVAIVHVMSDINNLTLQLRGNQLLSEIPEKTMYSISIRDKDSAEVVHEFPVAVFRNYHFTVDDAAVDGVLPEHPSIVNNSVEFLLA